MKKILIFAAIAITMAIAGCSRDYSKELVGTWDAGKATLEKNMTVIIKGDGTMSAEIKDLGMKPVKGTYNLKGNNVVFKLPAFDLSYRIVKLNREVLVMKYRDARITWNRLQ
jgi:hypothetical protein